MGLAVGNIQLAQLNQAFIDMRQARLNCSHNNSLWPLAHTWSNEQHKLLKAYHQGTYQLSPQTTYAIKDELISQFDAKDSVLFRAIATQIKEQLSAKFANTIMHLKGHGSIKGVLRHISALLPQFNYFYKTDVTSFYQSINAQVCMAKAAVFIKDKRILNILAQLFDRIEWCSGEYLTHNKGIPKGCPLSPLIGALYLNDLAKRFKKSKVKIIIYMDDILILSRTQWQLINARRTLYKELRKLKLTTRPEKTDVGLIQKGFNFLGYRITREGLSLSRISLSRLRERVRQLYEQTKCQTRLAAYLTRFYNWAKGGLPDLVVPSLIREQILPVVDPLERMNYLR